MKSKHLRILYLEDDPIDFELTVAVFESAGYKIEAERVESKAEFTAKLTDDDWDLVLADYNLPAFNGIKALEIVKAERPELPFILLSGALGEELAIEAVQKGASDYVLKQRMERLVHAAQNAISAAEDSKRRMQAEKALIESEERHRRYLTHAPGGIFVVDESSMINWSNLAAAETTGYDQAELQGLALGSIVPEKNREAFLQLLKNLHETSPSETELILLHKSGERRRLVCELMRMDHDEIMLMTRDVTREHNLQVDLFQAQKRESIGRLAGGVAHDFNNMLSIILGYSEEIANHPLAPEDLRDMGREIISAARHSARLTNQLLAFSRKQSLKPAHMNLNDTIEQFVKMLDRLLGEDITLALDLAPELDNIFVDKGQIEQIIMNLAVNARDAMPTGGTLTIRTQNTVVEQGEQINGGCVEPGRYVELQVQDTGCGMDELTINNAFEPFFTTKPQGKGTGLGLSSVYGVIKQSKGEIVLQSELNKGTLIRVLLPAAESLKPEAATASAATTTCLDGKCILVVEDEPSLAHILSRMLEQANCCVTVTHTAEEALGLLTSRQVTPDLLLSDVVLPGMHGGALAAKAHKLLPHMPVLFMSGYTDDVILNHGGYPPGSDMIPKPFTYLELRKKISQMLPGISWR